MYGPPIDPRDVPTADEPSWARILVGYAAIPAVLLILWGASRPLAALVALTAFAVLTVAVRRTSRLAQCFYECERMVFDLGGRVRITIRQPAVEETATR